MFYFIIIGDSSKTSKISQIVERKFLLHIIHLDLSILSITTSFFNDCKIQFIFQFLNNHFGFNNLFFFQFVVWL